MTNPITTHADVIEVTPVLDTSAYADGDRMGAVFEIPRAVRAPGKTATLASLTVVDKSKQKAAFDVYLFKSSPTVASADNAAIDISDAEMASKYLGKVSIGTSDYEDLANSAEAFKGEMTRVLKAAADSQSIYGLLVSRGAPTYAADGLVLKFGLLQD